MNAREILPKLGFVRDEQQQLNAGKDWTFKFPPGKKHTALVGLAIDRRIRHQLSLRQDIDVLQPLNQYAPYDLYFEGMHIDIKSFSKKTVSITGPELRFVRRLWAQGGDLTYALFEQLEGGREYEEPFAFRGFVLASDLKTTKELRDSTLDDGAYFFVANAKKLIFG